MEGPDLADLTVMVIRIYFWTMNLSYWKEHSYIKQVQTEPSSDIDKIDQSEDIADRVVAFPLKC